LIILVLELKRIDDVLSILGTHEVENAISWASSRANGGDAASPCVAW